MISKRSKKTTKRCKKTTKRCKKTSKRHKTTTKRGKKATKRHTTVLFVVVWCLFVGVCSHSVCLSVWVCRGGVVTIHPWLTACRGCESLSLIPHRRRAHTHAREVRQRFCACRAASRPPALTLAACSACLLIPLLGCLLPCLPPSPFPLPLDQVIRNLQTFLVLFALPLHSLISRHQGK